MSIADYVYISSILYSILNMVPQHGRSRIGRKLIELTIGLVYNDQMSIYETLLTTSDVMLIKSSQVEAAIVHLFVGTVG